MCAPKVECSGHYKMCAPKVECSGHYQMREHKCDFYPVPSMNISLNAGNVTYIYVPIKSITKDWYSWYFTLFNLHKQIYVLLLGYLAVCCQPKLFEELITRILEGLAQGQNAQQNFSVNNTKTYIQAIGAIR